MNISSISHKQLPERLLSLHDPPEQLWARGAQLRALLDKPCLAVVGSRAATPYGQRVTEQLAEAAARAGVVVISGLALGIDSIAHKAALAVKGATIAVLPASVTNIYPASHQGLAEHIIASGGALISEYTGAKSPHRHQFIARNRLIAALADAVLIPEAAEKSGSLHTANFALDLGKDVLVVPGPITSASSKGVNQLLKTGAIPITGSQDILDYFQLEQPQQIRLIGANREEQTILSLLQQGICAGSELQSLSKLAPAVFNQTLSMLEISGVIVALGGNQWRLT